MKVLSLFDGMACGTLAMMEAGVVVDRYVAYETDKYAAQTSAHNFQAIEHMGDVFQADFTEFRGFDYLVGGSPCTYWSIAQKNNRETEASGAGWELFSQYVRAVKEAQPKYFIYENNKSMASAIRESITRSFGFEPICINSALVSAQNRQRLYWVGRRNFDGTYSRVKVEQPADRGILLKDVVDGLCWRDKAYTIDSNYHKTLGRQGFGHQSWRRKMVAEPVCVAQRGRYSGSNIEQRFEVRSGGKTNALTTVQKDNNICEPVFVGAGVNAGTYALPVEFNAGTPVKAISLSDGKTYPVYEVDGGEITVGGKRWPIKLADGYYIIRKLTVSECKRLQTVPEWYEFPVSDSRAYKMLGNGWTVAVIAHLIAATLEDVLEDEQLDLFRLGAGEKCTT